MAKLSAHGAEIGRAVYLTSTKAYMSDGAVLKNYGDGWKLSGKLKPGVTPEHAVARAVAGIAEWEQARPAGRAYKKALHAIAGQSKRYRLHLAISLMPDDCDGVWSECCDGYCDNVHASVDEIAELCALYRAAQTEGKNIAATTVN